MVLTLMWFIPISEVKGNKRGSGRYGNVRAKILN